MCCTTSLAIHRWKQGRVDGFFERLYERVWNNPQLPTWSGELYLEYHRGTYTSQGRTKQANRAAELLYREAEWLNAWAHTLGTESRQDQLNAGWKITLLNQFHDILPGSSVPLVYEESNAQFATVLRVGAEVRDAAAEVVANAGDGGLGMGDGRQRTEEQEPTTQNQEPKTDDASQGAASSVSGLRSSVVFNSLPWNRKDYVRLPLDGDDAQSIEGTQVVEELGWQARTSSRSRSAVLWLHDVVIRRRKRFSSLQSPVSGR